MQNFVVGSLIREISPRNRCQNRPIPPSSYLIGKYLGSVSHPPQTAVFGGFKVLRYIETLMSIRRLRVYVIKSNQVESAHRSTEAPPHEHTHVDVDRKPMTETKTVETAESAVKSVLGSGRTVEYEGMTLEPGDEAMQVTLTTQLGETLEVRTNAVDTVEKLADAFGNKGEN